MAPSVTPELYRLLGANAARHAKGGTPDPARNPYSDEANRYAVALGLALT